MRRGSMPTAASRAARSSTRTSSGTASSRSTSASSRPARGATSRSGASSTRSPRASRSRSYLPEILYRYGEDEAAYARILALTDPAKERREYPEVPFAVVGRRRDRPHGRPARCHGADGRDALRAHFRDALGRAAEPARSSTASSTSVTRRGTARRSRPARAGRSSGGPSSRAFGTN